MLLMVSLTIFTGMLIAASGLAEISVGVKEGEWIEYQVAYTGTVPEEHDVTWGKIEIIDVQEKKINIKIAVRYSNGTQETVASTLDLGTGQLGDAFIIPANLKIGDTFLEKNEGNITIIGVEERTCVGARRSVVHATTSQTIFYWDQLTGVLVEAKSSFADYTMTTKAYKTNVWQAQIFGLDPNAFYALVIAVIAIVATVAFFVMRRRKPFPIHHTYYARASFFKPHFPNSLLFQNLRTIRGFCF